VRSEFGTFFVSDFHVSDFCLFFIFRNLYFSYIYSLACCTIVL